MKKNFYKKCTTKKYLVTEYEFDSLYEYIQYLNHARTSYTFRNQQLSSMKKSEKQTEFTGTQSFTEAVNLCLTGQYDSQFDKFDKTRMELETKLATRITKSRIKKDYVGFAPNVPAYLIGVPKNMYNTNKAPRTKPKTINIFYTATCTGSHTANQMQNRGICTLTLIKELEQQGFMVNLTICSISHEGNEILASYWHLKKTGQSIDYRSLYFPLANPSFLRRLEFRLVETTDGLSDEWTCGYGTSATLDFLNQNFDLKNEGIIITQPKEHNINGYDIVEDYKNFLDSIKSQLNKHVYQSNTNDTEPEV